MKKNPSRKQQAVVGVFALSVFSQAMAATIPFSTAPAGNGGVPPPPNLILTLDNSGSMGTSGMTALRNALTAAFQPDVVPENAVRLGWNTLNNGSGSMGKCKTFSTFDCGGNDIRTLNAAHRTNFLNWVASTSWNTSSITPTHEAYLTALKKFDLQPNDIKSPWAERPNEEVGTYYSCRKSYVMLMTDGAYNYGIPSSGVTHGGSANLDTVARMLPDGTIYSPASNPVLSIYADQDTGSVNTLSDLAFHYWARDLVPSGDNNIRPTIRFSGAQTVTSGTSSRTIPEYWNPANNPATWQHVVTHTIGFNAAANWPATSSQEFNSPSLTVPYFNGQPAFASGLNSILAGAVTWPRLYLEHPSVRTRDSGNVGQRKKTEMWHMAINSRGNFYQATTAQDLVDAIKDIVQNVTNDTSQRITSAAGSSLSARTDAYAYYTTYNANKWSGDVLAQGIAAMTSATPPASPWADTAANLLKAKSAASRNILTSGVDAGSGAFSGYSFEWANLKPAQQTALNGDGRGTQRVNYLRGDHSLEPATFRERDGKLGDIVNSKIWFMRGKPNAGYLSSDYLAFARSKDTRKDTIFVGANDGMLHAFDATNGQELFAYVPQGAYANLTAYSNPGYVHRYFVDGSPFTADYKVGANWKTGLVGFMGAGGKGYFILDVTNPASVTGASVIADTTASTDPDIGHIFQEPVTEQDNPMVTRQIAQLNNGEWALITGNGYNSTDEKAVLLIHFLTGGSAGTIKKIYATTTPGNSNGLSAPRLIDMNGDSVPDVVYAGDLRGNLWKFDIASTFPSSWSLASSTPILQAKNDSGQIQAITTAPIYTPHSEGGLMVVVGTGRNLTNGDRTDTTVQSYYGVHDDHFTMTSSTRGGITISGAPSVLNRSELVQQTAPSRSSTSGTVSDANVWTQSNNTVDYNTKKGWYLDLPFSGERVIENPLWFEGTLLDLLTKIPANGSNTNEITCEASLTMESLFTRTVDAQSGGLPKHQLFSALDGGGSTDANVYERGLNPNVRRSGPDKDMPKCVGADCTNPPERSFAARTLSAPSWRQLK